MIKHDYKPQNNKRFFEPSYFDRFPSWATHPFMIIGFAALVMLIAILINRDGQKDVETEPSIVIQEDASESRVNKGELVLTNLSSETIQTEPNSTQKATLTNQALLSLTNYSAPIDIPLEIESVSAQSQQTTRTDLNDKWQKESVNQGDNLSLIFKRIDLSPQMVHKVITLDENTKILKKLKPGEVIHYQLNNAKQLVSLKYTINLQNTLYVNRHSVGDTYEYSSEIINKSIEHRTAYISGIIEDSLYLSGKRAGLTDRLVINLANIFAWDLDFILDIRKNDSFSLLYEEKYLDGELIGNGNIIAAEFINRGQTYRAIRYTDSKNNTNYYSESGLSMRKAFLRAPVDFRYISDSFNPKRFHPVQKRIKPHRGIDYAAPVGTPIRASGDGKVIASGYNRFNGKYVFIQHGNNIVTKYLHLSKRTVSRGKRVKQGQTIGKLGSTGMVTGPHLHYEFVVNGVHRNPRTVKLPKADPIRKSEKANFLKASEMLVAQLESRKQIQSSELVAR